MNLSTHFTLDEFTRSQKATRFNIDNTPSPRAIENMKRVAATLEQVRQLVRAPLNVSSGYRSPALNRAVGGAENPPSAHLFGLAVDFNASGLTPRELAIKIRDSDIEYDQLIYEGAWVHLGLSIGAPRREVLTAIFHGGDRATYPKGIV